MSIATHDAEQRKADVWTRLAAPLPTGVISWRQDGKIVTRDGKHFARFVAYIEANTARERLDTVVPGEWDLTLELLPPLAALDGGVENDAPCAFKARLTVLDVVREDVGSGRDYKAAATDAFKRAAVRFGIAHELYAYEQNWVQMDGDGRNAKPVEDPGVVYARRFGPVNGASLTATDSGRKPDAVNPTRTTKASTDSAPSAVGPTVLASDAQPKCPKCGGRMWDNRLSKRTPKAPDYKCRDRQCDGVIWPSRPKGQATEDTGDAFDDVPPFEDIPF